MNERRFRKRSVFLRALPRVRAPAHLLDGQHVASRRTRRSCRASRFWPQHFTWDNYKRIFTDASWYSGYINSLIYVGDQHGDLARWWRCRPPTPSRATSFLGDKHVFFWLLTNRMTPPAVFLLPFFQLYTTLGLMDTHIARGAGAPAVQRAAGGVDPRRLHERHAARDRRDRLHRRLLVPALLPHASSCR